MKFRVRYTVNNSSVKKDVVALVCDANKVDMWCDKILNEPTSSLVGIDIFDGWKDGFAEFTPVVTFDPPLSRHKEERK